jgi:hypothetical protein
VRQQIAVEARFEPDGAMRILAFERGGVRHVVAASGRQWTTEDGRHFLVMTPAEQVLELLYQPQSAGAPWMLVREFQRGSGIA